MDKFFPHISVDAGSDTHWTHERKWERRHHRHQAKKACKEMAKSLDLELIEDNEYHQSRVPGNTVYRDDYLSPLFRWLEHNIGQPWDKIFSQFCHFVPQNNLRGDHLHSHLIATGFGGGVYPNLESVLIRTVRAYGFYYYIDDEGYLRRYEKKWDITRWPSQKEIKQSIQELVEWGGGMEIVGSYVSWPHQGVQQNFYPLNRKMINGYWGELSRVNWIDSKAYYRQTKNKVSRDDLMKLNSYHKSFHYIILG